MIFPPPLHVKVLAGQKTQHRIPRKTDQWECPHRAGKVLTVVKERGGEILAHVKVTHDRADTLAAITAKDAQREGFKRTDQAIAWYEQQWMVFDPDHAQPVWVLTFELEPERERFLTAQAGHLVSADYTTSTDDPLDAGATPPSMSIATYTKDAHQRQEEERAAVAASRNRLPLHIRLRNALELADARGVKVDQLSASIRDNVEKIERRVERAV